MSVENPITDRAAALRAYADNAMYFARGGDLVKCENFIEACTFLLRTPVTRTEHSGEGTEVDPSIINGMRADALLWYNANYSRLANGRARLSWAEGDF